MQEMVEPDRTIVIVSIIGLVVIWGSVLYHKFVQGAPQAPEATADAVDPAAVGDSQSAPVNRPPSQKKKRKKS